MLVTVPSHCGSACGSACLLSDSETRDLCVTCDSKRAECVTVEAEAESEFPPLVAACRDTTLHYTTLHYRDCQLAASLNGVAARLQPNRQAKLTVIVQELCESRGGRPGLSVLTSLLVSVDVKNY